MTDTDLETAFDELLAVAHARLGLADAQIAPPMEELLGEAGILAPLVTGTGHLRLLNERLLSRGHRHEQLFAALILRLAASRVGEATLPEVLPLLVSPAPWVRYHAVWAAVCTRSSSKELTDALVRVATSWPSTPEGKDADSLAVSLAKGHLANLERRRRDALDARLEAHTIEGLSLDRPLGWPESRSEWFPDIQWKRTHEVCRPEGMVQFESVPRGTVAFALSVKRGVEGSIEEHLRESLPEEVAEVSLEATTAGWQRAVATWPADVGTTGPFRVFRSTHLKGGVLVSYSATVPEVDLPHWGPVARRLVGGVRVTGG